MLRIARVGVSDLIVFEPMFAEAAAPETAMAVARLRPELIELDAARFDIVGCFAADIVELEHEKIGIPGRVGWRGWFLG